MPTFRTAFPNRGVVPVRPKIKGSIGVVYPYADRKMATKRANGSTLTPRSGITVTKGRTLGDEKEEATSHARSFPLVASLPTFVPAILYPCLFVFFLVAASSSRCQGTKKGFGIHDFLTIDAEASFLTLRVITVGQSE